MRAIVLHDLHYVMGETGVRVHNEFSSLVAQKIEQHKSEVVLIAGDTIVSNQKQFEQFLKIWRHKIKVPILWVYGNHDYWDVRYPRPRPYGEIRRMHAEMCATWDIHYLEDGPYRIRNIQFCGYDGWYGTPNPGSSDIVANKSCSMGSDRSEYRMLPYIESAPTHAYLHHRSQLQCDRVLSEADLSLVNVCVSHFDATRGHTFTQESEGRDMSWYGSREQLNQLGEKFDFIFYGHTHREINEVHGRANVLCAGGGYNHPIGLVVNIPESPDSCNPSANNVVETFKLPWTRQMKNDD